LNEAKITGFYLRRKMSGRNSFTAPKPMFQPMLIPKLTAASPTESALAGCQNRET
jgi:hypothetical protein